MSISCCCSQVVSPETLLVANGFLSHSDFEASTSLKYSENLFLQDTQVVDEKFVVNFCSVAGMPPFKKSKKHVKNVSFVSLLSEKCLHLPSIQVSCEALRH